MSFFNSNDISKIEPREILLRIRRGSLPSLRSCKWVHSRITLSRTSGHHWAETLISSKEIRTLLCWLTLSIFHQWLIWVQIVKEFQFGQLCLEFFLSPQDVRNLPLPMVNIVFLGFQQSRQVVYQLFV